MWNKLKAFWYKPILKDIQQITYGSFAISFLGVEGVLILGGLRKFDSFNIAPILLLDVSLAFSGTLVGMLVFKKLSKKKDAS